MKNEDKKPDRLTLPQRLVTPVDLARVARELKMLDDWLTQANLRNPGGSVMPPKTSTTLEELAVLNGITLLDQASRQTLINILAKYSERAPKIHMSFAVEPSAYFLERMIVWLRSNINPLILLEVGLQPTLAAGCNVRTTNKMFDMSLRQRFVDSRPLLVKSIEEITQDLPAPEPTAITAPTQEELAQAAGTTAPASPDTAAVNTPAVPEPAVKVTQANSEAPVTEVEPGQTVQPSLEAVAEPAPPPSTASPKEGKKPVSQEVAK